MKNTYYILIILCFAVSSAFSQEINRIEVFGKIVVDSVDVEGVTVYNTSSNKGTVTDLEGKFSIEVALNDIVENLVGSMVQTLSLPYSHFECL